MLLLKDGEIKSVLAISDIIECIEESFILHGKGETTTAPVVSLPIREESLIMAMPAAIRPLNIAGLKWVAYYRYNLEEYELPTHISTIFLNDSLNGTPLVVMDGNWITAIRTGAVSAVGAKYLAKHDSKIIGIIGAGVQARSNLLALSQVLHIDLVKVTSKRCKSRRRFAEEMQEMLGIDVLPMEKADTVVEDSDIVISTSPASYPYIRNEKAKKGVLIITLGSHIQTDVSFPRSADKIIVDDLEGFYPAGIGHFAEYVKKRIVAKENVYAKFGEIVVGNKRGRVSEEERIWFSHVGMAIHDVILGYRVYKKALEKGIGQHVGDFLGK